MKNTFSRGFCGFRCLRQRFCYAKPAPIPQRKEAFACAKAMVIVMTLGQRIQQIRSEHGLSQEEFAEKLGTTRQTVSRWELDQTYPEIAKIVIISKVLSVTTDSIL